MKISRRARRMERNHNKFKTPPLNLVSLMDIFTILVFFLLVSSSNTHQLPSNKDLTLPNSNSTSAPQDTLVIAITKHDILLDGVVIANISTTLASSEEVISGLQEELIFRATNRMNNSQELGPITIMSDENVSYELIRKVLTTCQQANYTRIAFAAMQTLTPRT